MSTIPLEQEDTFYDNDDHDNNTTISLHFNGHCPGGPGFNGTRMSPFWILQELRMMEVAVTTGVMRHAKLQSNRHHQQTNTQFFTARIPFLWPNQQCQSIEGNLIQPSTRYEYLSANLQLNQSCQQSLRCAAPACTSKLCKNVSKWQILMPRKILF